MKSKIRMKIVKSILCFSMILFACSCARDGFDDETFSGGVTDTQLQSPDASAVTFTKIAGTTNVKVSWPLVFGAGGYQFSYYINDDPANPVVVVKDSIIDGSSVACPYIEDTNYRVEIKTLGNEKYNNTDATTISEAFWSTMIDAVTIPTGTDLYAYFDANPITSGLETEVAYELEAGGSYTISKDLDFGPNYVQLRGNKVTHPTVTIADNAALINRGGGLALKFINFEYDAATPGSFFKFGEVPSEIVGAENLGIITDPIIFQSCNIRNVKNLVNINGKTYAIQNFFIRDCIVEAHQSTDFINFNSGRSFVKDLEISNSTFYSHTQSGNRFIRYGGGKATTVGWTSGSMKFISNTFYNISYSGQSFNGNGWSDAINSVQMSKNIFFNSCGGEFNRRIVMGANRVVKTCDNNCYWYNNAIPSAQEIDNNTYGDKSNTAYGVDPGFVDPSNGDFTPSNSVVISHESGDPRWLN